MDREAVGGGPLWRPIPPLDIVWVSLISRAGGLLSRTGVTMAPAMYLAGAAALTFVGAFLLPKTPQHSLTKEFQAARFR